MFVSPSFNAAIQHNHRAYNATAGDSCLAHVGECQVNVQSLHGSAGLIMSALH
jgi:hypothetical protein